MMRLPFVQLFSLRPCLALLAIWLLVAPFASASKNSKRKGKVQSNAKMMMPSQDGTSFKPSQGQSNGFSENKPVKHDLDTPVDIDFRQLIQRIIDTRSFLPRFLTLISYMSDKHPICQIDGILDECTVYSVANDLHLSIGSALLSFVVNKYGLSKEQYVEICKYSNLDYQKAFEAFEKKDALETAVDKMFEDLLAQYKFTPKGFIATNETEATTEDNEKITQLERIRDKFGDKIKQMLHEWVAVIGPKFVYGFYPANFIDPNAKSQYAMFSSLPNGPVLQQFFQDFKSTYDLVFLSLNTMTDRNVGKAYIASYELLYNYHFREVELLKEILEVNSSPELKGAFEAALKMDKSIDLLLTRMDAAVTINEQSIKKSTSAEDVFSFELRPGIAAALKTGSKSINIQVKSSSPVLATKAEPKRIKGNAPKTNTEQGKKTSTTPSQLSSKDNSKPPSSDKKKIEKSNRKYKKTYSETIVREPIDYTQLVAKTVNQSYTTEPATQPSESSIKIESKTFVENKSLVKLTSNPFENATCDYKAEWNWLGEQKESYEKEQKKALVHSGRLAILERSLICTPNGFCTIIRGRANSRNLHYFRKNSNLPVALITCSPEELRKIWKPALDNIIEVKQGHAKLPDLAKKFIDYSKTEVGELYVARLQSLLKYSSPNRNVTTIMIRVEDSARIESGCLCIPASYKNKTLVSSWLPDLIDGAISRFAVGTTRQKKPKDKRNEEASPKDDTQIEKTDLETKPKNTKEKSQTDNADEEEKVKDIPNVPLVLKPISILKKLPEPTGMTLNSIVVEVEKEQPNSLADDQQAYAPEKRLWSAVELAVRETLPPLETSQAYKKLLSKAGFENTGNLLTRLAVVEKLNVLISDNLRKNRVLNAKDSVHLEVYGSTRSLCALKSSDMDIIALFNKQEPFPKGISVMQKLLDIIKQYSNNQKSITANGLESGAVKRFNSFVGVNKLEDSVEPIRASFKITKVSYLESYGMITLVLDIQSNYSGPFRLDLDLSAHQSSISAINDNNADFSQVLVLPLDKQLEILNMFPNGKIGGLFALTNIYEEIIKTGCSIPTYLHLVRVVKKWAESRRIYNSLAGYLSSTAIMVTCASTVIEQHKLGGEMTLEALVPNFFDFMLQRFGMEYPPLISVLPLSDKEEYDITNYRYFQYRPFFPLIINPVPFAVPDSTVVNAKMSLSSSRVICMELGRALDILNNGKHPVLFKPISNDIQAVAFLKHLNKPKDGKLECFKLYPFQVTMDWEHCETEWNKDKAFFFLLAKQDGTDGPSSFKTANSPNNLYVLINTDPIEDHGLRKYQFYVITNSHERLSDFAKRGMKGFLRKKLTSSIFSSTDTVLHGYLFKEWTSPASSGSPSHHPNYHNQSPLRQPSPNSGYGGSSYDSNVQSYYSPYLPWPQYDTLAFGPTLSNENITFPSPNGKIWRPQ